MWHYNNNLYEKLSELRKVNRLSSTKMRFLLKTNQIILINHIERLPYERHETPFKEYTVMSNNLIQNLNCSDVYRTYTLLLTADKDSLETNTTLKQLAGFVGEELDNYKKSKSTLSFNDKLRATGEVVIRDIDSKQKDRHWTMYRFNQVEPGNYRRIGREFYDTYNTLDLKLRGFILKLFSVTEPHSYVIKLSSIRKLKELIHMGHNTIGRYIEQLKDLDLLDENW